MPELSAPGILHKTTKFKMKQVSRIEDEKVCQGKRSQNHGQALYRNAQYQHAEAQLTCDCTTVPSIRFTGDARSYTSTRDAWLRRIRETKCQLKLKVIPRQARCRTQPKQAISAQEKEAYCVSLAALPAPCSCFFCKLVVERERVCARICESVCKRV